MARDDLQQRVLFLQGPPGPLFRLLARRFRARGIPTVRINISGGDHFDWRGPAIDFRAPPDEWPAFIERQLAANAITDIVLFGDCRPYHIAARRAAAQRGVRVHVLEEGYVRPNWMTLERDGVNANSTLPRDPDWFVREARRLNAATSLASLPPVTSKFARRARDGFWYYAHITLRRFWFPHYRSHRPVNVFVEAAGWCWRLIRQSGWQRRAERVIDTLDDRPFFLFPLQLSTDYQIRLHSPFPDMLSAAQQVVHSFAAHADLRAHLLIKVHPLDVSLVPWRTRLERLARELGVNDRLHVIDGSDLETMIERAQGVVCVNSTSATLALAKGVPVCVTGSAIYDVPRLTEQRGLDAFWRSPPRPDPSVFAAFRDVLVDRCLVRGGIASESAVATLIDAITKRLIRLDAMSVAEQSRQP